MEDSTVYFAVAWDEDEDLKEEIVRMGSFKKKEI